VAEIPTAVLSEQFQKRVNGRRLKTAVFLTYALEPDFFEQEVLPVVLPDLPLRNVSAIRQLQLEDALKSDVDHLAVYFDRGKLMPGANSAKLDWRRIPVSHFGGYFHPKNVFLLVESQEPHADGHRVQSLLVAAMSANLTRAGWWENVEVCHIEEVAERTLCSYRADLLEVIRRVKASAHAEEKHEALEIIRKFVVQLRQRQRSTSDGLLYPRFYCGQTSVVDFLDETLGRQLDGLNLEVISPYFDRRDSAPLRELCARFTPASVRVFLPRAEDGSAQCDPEFYDAARRIERVAFAQLPVDLRRNGKTERARPRTVHAKVYRFFDPKRCYEAFFVGSVNLTKPAHARTGNFETAFLLEEKPTRIPDWWLVTDSKRPQHFGGIEGEDEESATTALVIRFDWERKLASAYWDAKATSGRLAISAQGAPLFVIDSVPPSEWQALGADAAVELERVLPSTSFLGVSEDGKTLAVILVQEDRMAHKPSLLSLLSAEDILRYWALLSAEQRAAFVEEHADLLAEVRQQLGLDARQPLPATQSIFGKFAGIYQAFAAQENAVLQALVEGRAKEAEYRLLGNKYDSLPKLLERVLNPDSEMDLVSRYVIALCARQVVRRVEREHPEFRDGRRASFRRLNGTITKAERLRDRFQFGSAVERTEFLSWFDEWFLARVEPVEFST
jgi:hypothetical protein